MGTPFSLEEMKAIYRENTHDPIGNRREEISQHLESDVWCKVAWRDRHFWGRKPILGRGIAGKLHPLPSGVKDAPVQTGPV